MSFKTIIFYQLDNFLIRLLKYHILLNNKIKYIGDTLYLSRYCYKIKGNCIYCNKFVLD